MSKIFKKLNVPFDDELSSFKFSTFGPKNVHQMKDEPEIHIPPAENVSQSHGTKRKRENPISMEHLLKCLQPEFQSLQPELEPPRESSPVSKDHARLLENFAKNPLFPKFQNLVDMQSFFENTAPTNKASAAAPLYVSPPKTNYSALFRSESIDKFFMDPPFYESSVPPKSYHNVQFTSPSFNVLTGAPLPPCMDEPPPKKTKIEREIKKIRKDVLKLFEAFHGIMNHTVYDSMESTCLRQWYNSLSAKWGIDAPMTNPFPPPLAIPMPVPSNYHLLMDLLLLSEGYGAVSPFLCDKGGEKLEVLLLLE